MEGRMIRTILVFGTIAGLAVGIPLSCFALAFDGAPPPYGMAIGYTMMLVALSAVFVGVKRHRDVALGGTIRFWPAFGMGLAISAVAGIFYVLAWETAVAVSGIDFARAYATAMIEQERARGASAAELARFTAEMATFQAQYANPLFRLPMTFTEIFPVGILVSLVSAGLLRNSRFLPARHG
jgi:hypothetical protein